MKIITKVQMRLVDNPKFKDEKIEKVNLQRR